MRVDVLTTFPDLFTAEAPGVLGVSIPRRAIDRGAIEVHATNIRDHAEPPHFKTDDRPFGGGPGMVMLCGPLYDAVHAAERADTREATRILLTPQGAPLTQPMAEELALLPRVVLICGHYEGIDERVIDELKPRQISIGDFVLSSGELAALVLIDALARLQPGVLGHERSSAQDSFSPVPAHNPSGEPLDEKRLGTWCKELGISPDDRLLDCPHYTRPRTWRDRAVPEELLSGDHDKVARWRLGQMVARTRGREETTR
ncbi:MAG: tRNA (guanine(37)-N(1))-methyltransferase [Planctomycetota bacterium]